MTAAIWLRNVAAYAIQVGVLVAAGAVLARVLRIEAPRIALAYWRGLLAACLLLPLCQPWQTTPSALPRTATIQLAAARIGNSVSAPVQATPSKPPVERLAIAVLCAGFTARACWLVLGAWVLGRIRRGASRLEPVPEAIARAEGRVGVSAVFYVSGRIAGPVTFGVRSPAIVFPPGVAAMDPSIQYAIACHELLHVRRRDWLFQVIEESIRAVVWFHPAVWWLIGRIQLTREQVVDQEAAALLESRERYVEALLAVAIAKSPRLLTFAPAFFRRSLLKKRVAQILQESTMTTGRSIVSLGASAAVLALAGVMTVRAFPLQAQGEPAASRSPVQIVKGGEHLLHGEVPEYPRRAIEDKVEGDVLLDLSVDDQGEVADARVLSGPDELRKATLETVLNWHYAPAAVRSSSVQATVRFNLAAANNARPAGRITEMNGRVYTSEIKEQHGELTRPQQLERMIAELEHALNDEKVTGSQREEYKAKLAEATTEMAHINAERNAMEQTERTGGPARMQERYSGPLRLVAFETERVSRDAAAEVLQRAGLKIGDTITEASLTRLRESASAVDEHFHVVMHDDGRGSVSLVLVSRE
jgi:bla regulator protein BlaR1